MSYPSVVGANVFLSDGFTQIVWGTEAFGFFAGGSYPNAYIVVSAKSEQISETVNLPQSDGLTAVSIDVIDGQRWQIIVVDDQSIDPPGIGQIVTLQNVFIYSTGGNGAIPPYDTNTVSVGRFKIENNEFTTQREEFGTRTLVAKAYCAIPQIAGGGNPTLVNSIT